MNIQHYLTGLLAFSLGSTAAAGTMGPSQATNQWTPVLSLSAGPIWANGGTLQNVYFDPELSRTYTVNNTSKSLAYGDVFIGLQRDLNPNYEGQLGLVFGSSSALKISGDVWDYTDPRFDYNSYSYKVQHNHLSLKGKLLAKTRYSLKPWLGASIGVGFNRARTYIEIPKVCKVEALPEALFANHTTTAFTYSLSAGVQRVLTSHWQIGVGYEFADWGKSRLGGATGQEPGTYGLTLNRTHSNGLLFNLTWLA